MQISAADWDGADDAAPGKSDDGRGGAADCWRAGIAVRCAWQWRGCPSGADGNRLFQSVQAEFKGTKIFYKLAKQSGPDHRREFIIDLYLGKEKISSGFGMSKKAAEENAAVEAIGKLSLDKNI